MAQKNETQSAKKVGESLAFLNLAPSLLSEKDYNQTFVAKGAQHAHAL
jgi:hypothetical protein